MAITSGVLFAAESVELKSDKNKRFWQTSHARSFRCLLLHDISLSDEDQKYSATIHFDEARVQALTKTRNFKTREFNLLVFYLKL